MTKSESFVISAVTRSRCFPASLEKEFLAWASKLVKRELSSEDLYDDDVWTILYKKNIKYFNMVINSITD